MNKVSEAICFATEAFDGKIRKGDGGPAIFHSIEAASVVQEICGDEDTVCAAVLHDTVEDAGITIEQIREKFGERVAFLVASETEEKYRSRSSEETWQQRKEESLKVLMSTDDQGIHAMWLGDKLSNIRSFARLKKRYGDNMWQFFNQKDPMKHKWYYETIASELDAFSDTSCYNEYISLLKNIFGE